MNLTKIYRAQENSLNRLNKNHLLNINVVNKMKN